MDMAPIERAFRRLARSQGKEHLLDVPVAVSDTDLIVLDQQRIAESRRSSFFESLPELYKEMTFLSWSDTDREAFAKVESWCESFPKVRAGLYLYSRERGSGKTHLAIAAGRALSEHGYAVNLVDVVALLSRLRNGFEKKHPRIDVEAIGRFCDVLIMDDLGAEKPSEWVSEQLYLLVNTAVAHKASLIVTTNCNFKQLAERMDDRIVSRIIGATDMVQVVAGDYRVAQHKARRA